MFTNISFKFTTGRYQKPKTLAKHITVCLVCSLLLKLTYHYSSIEKFRLLYIRLLSGTKTLIGSIFLRVKLVMKKSLIYASSLISSCEQAISGLISRAKFAVVSVSLVKNRFLKNSELWIKKNLAQYILNCLKFN